MLAHADPNTPAPNPSLLHAVLTGGYALVLGFAAFRIFGGFGPFLGAAESTGVIGYVMAGAAIMTLVVGGVFLRGRLPPRAATQSAEDYWKATGNLQAAVLLWTVLEGGGMIAAVGWMMTGNLAAMAAALMALAALFLLTPGSLAGR